MDIKTREVGHETTYLFMTLNYMILTYYALSSQY